VSAETAEGSATAATTTFDTRSSRSHVVSEEGAKELLELIPTATLIDVAGAGHMVAGDDNDVFSGGLKGFLDEDVAASGQCPPVEVLE